MLLACHLLLGDRIGGGGEGEGEVVRERDQIAVVMVIGLFHPFVGGAEKGCLALSKKLVQRGVTVTVVTQYLEGLPAHEVVEGIPVYRAMRGGHLWELGFMLSAARFLWNHRRAYDIIQCSTLFHYIPVAIFFKYLLGKKVVVRLEGGGWRGDFQRLEQVKGKKVICWAAKRADVLVAISDEIEKEIVERGFPQERVARISNAVDCTLFKPKSSYWHNRETRIGYVGRLEEGKGVELLIDAVGEIISQLPALQLFIVGNGSLKPRLVEKVNDMGMGERIIFLGDKESVHDEYTTFDLLVMPSFSEGMSCVVLEAMACGLPVVATSVGGNSELMDPVDRGKTPIESGSFRIGQNGLLVNPGDTQGLGRAMRYLIEHKSRAEELGRCARKAVETHYSLENISDDYVALYRDLRR